MISSSSDHTSDSEIDVPLKTLNQPNESRIGSVISFGRLTRILRKFADDDHLVALDRRLLKGFYTSSKKELCVDSDDQRGISIKDADEDPAINSLLHNSTDKNSLVKAMMMFNKKPADQKKMHRLSKKIVAKHVVKIGEETANPEKNKLIDGGKNNISDELGNLVAPGAN